jgi:hypothetical protein
MADRSGTSILDRPLARSGRERSIDQLRAVLSMLCHFVWHRELRPGEHLWSIPVDQERDFDCILSDAIDELERRRAASKTDDVIRWLTDEVHTHQHSERIRAFREVLARLNGEGAETTQKAQRPRRR